MAVNNFRDLDRYYDDLNQHGNHQYVTLKEIVNNFMFSQDDDSFVGNVNRNRAVYFAKRGIQELYFDVLNEVISLEFELNPSLIIPLPHDYVSYVRISTVDEQGRIHPLAVDKSHNLSQAYLQDNAYDFLYDNVGNILEGDHIQSTLENTPNLNSPEFRDNNVGSYYNRTPGFNVDRSKIFRNGSFKIDKNRGILQFSSEIDGKTIVLEYISDGTFQLDDSEIRVHKFAEEALYNYIYLKLISTRRNVSQSEKERARRDFYNVRRIAKRRITNINYEDVRQILKGSSKFVKD